MTQICHEVHLTIPPLITIKVPNIQFVKQVRTIFQNRKTSQFNNLQDEIANSAALLSRLMARRKNSFRNMNGFKFVCKLNTALSRLLKVDVEQVLSNFYELLPDPSYKFNEVPSRNSFDYILLRLISVHKIYHRASYCCLESAAYFNKLLRNNFFMETITLFLTVIANLWDLTNKLGNTYSEFYTKLVDFRNFFPQVHSQNSLKNVAFPKELDQFSTPAAIEMFENPTQLNTIRMDQELVFVHKTPNSVINVLPKLQKQEDFGMAISRESLKPVIDLSHIHNIDDIRNFFKEESEKRHKSMNLCATKYILKHEWLSIQKLVERKIIANDHKKALSVFRKFITSKT